MKKKITVLVVEPCKEPYTKEISAELSSMQELVGGYIQALYPFDEAVAVVCNEEGKLHSLPLNRALYDDDGNIYDVVAGTFFVCAAPADSDEFESLSEDQIEKYRNIFKCPEMFFYVSGELVVVRG